MLDILLKITDSFKETRQKITVIKTLAAFIQRESFTASLILSVHWVITKIKSVTECCRVMLLGMYLL